MPECQHCGAHVTRRYARVFTPNDIEDPRCCPDCPDRIRDDGQVRQTRSHRDTGAKTHYDPAHDGGGDDV